MAEVEYPKDHQPGMRVPRGGSMCANCEYFNRNTMDSCNNEYFIRWNGSNIIPGRPDEYCSDFYEPEHL